MSRFVSLAGAQVAELAERSAEAGRLSRGRTLFRKGSVSDLLISEGSIIASVRGSEGDEYETTIGTALAPPGVIRQLGRAQDPEDHRSIEDLMEDGLEICPRDMDLAFSCDCADWDEPCKHVVAVILAFADRVDLDETELLRWRGIDLSTAEDQPDMRNAERDRSGHSAQERDRHRSEKLSELEALLGDTAVQVPTKPAAEPQQSEPAPAMAAFLGIGAVIQPVDTSGIAAPAPLFTDVQLGPLADLGPELALALSLLRSTHPE